MPRGLCHRHGGERPCTCAMGNLYRFVEPVVLYLLARDGPAYGYELAVECNKIALTDAQIDRAALYRTLQSLEANGHVTSSWDTSGGGPARHTYEISAHGLVHLNQWGEVLGNLAHSMQTFAHDVNALGDSSGVAADLSAVR